MIKKVSFKNTRGLTLRGFLYKPRKFDTAVVFCHGFPSSSRGYSASHIGPALGKAGFLVLCFDFSHTPVSDGRFEDKLMSREVRDIKSAVDFLMKNYPVKKLVLIGHSTGAIDASLYASSDKRISKLVLSGAVADLKNAVRYDFKDIDVRDFWTKGYVIYNRPGHWVHGRKIKKAFYDEFFKLDIPKAIKRFKKPLLIIHGEKDIIPYESEAYRLYKMANRPKKFVLIGGADHSFTSAVHWRQFIKKVVSFIKD